MRKSQKNKTICFIKATFTLKNISFSLVWGDCLGIVGGSGSGKTTLGRVLCGLEKNFNLVVL